MATKRKVSRKAVVTRRKSTSKRKAAPRRKAAKKTAKTKDVTKAEIKVLATKTVKKPVLKPRGSKTVQRKAYYTEFRKSGHSAVDAADFAAAVMKKLKSAEKKSTKPATRKTSTRKTTARKTTARRSTAKRPSAPRGPISPLSGSYRMLKQKAMVGAAKKKISYTANRYQPLNKLQANIVRLNQIIRARGGVGLV